MDDPFHRGERAAQELAGVWVARGGILDAMPPQYSDFFASLPCVAVAVADRDGWPLASMVVGSPGFVSSADPHSLRIGGLPAHDDPVNHFLRSADAVGLLGIDFATRRRIRVNGIIAKQDETGFEVAVRQSFANCPKYIHRRTVIPQSTQRGPVQHFSAWTADMRARIAAADTVFVASFAPNETEGGVDISHRGGPIGFVVHDGDGLVVPDYAGNNYFNTLGNLLLNPRAGLLVPNFESGDLLLLQGWTEIIWQTPDQPRAWRFNLRQAWLHIGALSLRWSQVIDRR